LLVAPGTALAACNSWKMQPGKSFPASLILRTSSLARPYKHALPDSPARSSAKAGLECVHLQIRPKSRLLACCNSSAPAAGSPIPPHIPTQMRSLRFAGRPIRLSFESRIPLPACSDAPRKGGSNSVFSLHSLMTRDDHLDGKPSFEGAANLGQPRWTASAKSGMGCKNFQS